MIRHALDRVVLESLRPLALGLAVINAVFVPFNLLDLPGHAVGPVVAGDLVLVIVYLAARAAVGRGLIPANLANQVAVIFGGLVLTNVLLAMVLLSEPFYTLYVAIIAIGFGTLLLSGRWLTVALIGTVAAWVVPAVLATDTPKELIHLCFILFASVALSVVHFVTRVRDCRRVALLRHRDEQRTQVLAEALQGAQREIEDRQQAERALRFSEQRYRGLFDNMTSGAVVLEVVEDGARMVVVEVNRSAGQMVGRDPVDLVGITVEQALPAAAGIGLGEILHQVWQTGRPVRRSLEHREEGRLATWLEVQAYRLASGHLVVILDDESDQRRAEEHRLHLVERVREAQKTESFTALTGGIAHEFNNLLTGVLANADLMRRSLDESSPMVGDLDEIVTSARRAAELSGQMLAYSGRGSFATEPLDLRELVDEVQAIQVASLPAEVALEVRMAQTVPPIVADAAQLRQVLLALVGNAVEAIGERGGRITLTVEPYGDQAGPDDPTHRARWIPAPLDGPRVLLQVEDDGPGMDEATRSRLFEPFFTTKFTGRGLGMAAVLGIVRGHRGAIDVRSHPGRGTRVRILLPVAEAPPVTEPLVEEEWRPAAHVLLVDDDPIIRRAGSRMLRRMGCEVTLASDGQEAVEVYRAEGGRFDLVMLDMTMPRLSGVEAFHQIRLHDPSARVLLCSGYSEEDIAAGLRSQGLAGFLAKPFDLAALRGRLREVLPN